ncbi:hypothetical protein EUTSA_v10003295mg [Eutrema salsugineum]|uniref:Uncharacterized protein n=1 Tax=Eutrema salsugineum TaxID=72664 RepID=V4L2Y8_EUTSA|nr:hypothetical protein EUTSA_v10003295mg [Eutrema salsugineum]
MYHHIGRITRQSWKESDTSVSFCSLAALLRRSRRWIFMWPPKACAFVKPLLQKVHSYIRLVTVETDDDVRRCRPVSDDVDDDDLSHSIFIYVATVDGAIF